MPPRKPPSTTRRDGLRRKLRQHGRMLVIANVLASCLVKSGRITSTARRPAPSSNGTLACPLHNPARPSPTPCTHRFGEILAVDENLAGLDELARLAGRRVHRRYTDRAVDPEAAAAPVRLRAVGAEQERSAAGRHPDPRARPSRTPSPISFPTSRSSAPRRRSWCSSPTAGGLPEISKMRGKPFPNDHLDQFFNAAVDAGIVLATFIARRRRGRARHLPDQRDPRPFGAR